MATQPRSDMMSDPDAGWSLPAWTYSDPDFFQAEIDRVFRPSWQIVCHESDIPQVGDYHTLDYIGESVIVVRGDDRVVRAFTNVCRHRGARLVDGPSGCASRLTCPYHAWSYDLKGALTGLPLSQTYGGMDRTAHGLAPVQVEIWQSFIFVRLEDDGGPSVAEMMQLRWSPIASPTCAPSAG